MKRTIIALAAVAFLPGAALAADRTVQVDDPQIAEALKGTVGASEISEEVGRAIGIKMYADNDLTRNESDLFLELLSNLSGSVNVTDPNGETFAVPVLSPGARSFLELSDIPDIAVFWLAGPAEMKKLVDVTILSPQVRPQIQHFIANQLYLRWRTSSYVNNYSPLRTTLSAAFVQWRDAGPETFEIARGLLYDAVVELDMAVNDAVPDEFHESLTGGAG